MTTGAALLWAAAADNATHTIVATVLNDKYAPLFELWHPRFAAATDATVELVVACLDGPAGPGGQAPLEASTVR